VKGIAMEILKLDRITVQQTKTREVDGADVFQVNWSPPVLGAPPLTFHIPQPSPASHS
jgi:hypothetical protein